MTRRERYCCLLRKAIADERAAIRMYRRLARLAPNRRVRGIYLAIMRDEMTHNRVDRQLHRTYC